MAGAPVVGVMALQGAFRAHADHLGALGVATREVRTPDDIVGIDALVLPGGESTAMSNLLRSSGLDDSLRRLVADRTPILATCAGLILLADEVLDGRADQLHFGAIDAVVRRNGYGRQRDSFEADLDVVGLDVDAGGHDRSDERQAEPFHGVFIRAPRIELVGPAVEVLAEHAGDPVLIRAGAVTAATFHPELADDLRIHAAFVATIPVTTPAATRR